MARIVVEVTDEFYDLVSQAAADKQTTLSELVRYSLTRELGTDIKAIGSRRQPGRSLEERREAAKQRAKTRRQEAREAVLLVRAAKAKM